MKNDLQDNKAAKKLRHKQNRKRARKASRIVYSLNEHEFIVTSSDSHNLNQSQNRLHVFDVFFDMKESMSELEVLELEEPELEVLELNDITFVEHVKREISIEEVKEDSKSRRIVLRYYAVDELVT
jgi:hypothetical protein